MAFTTPGTAVAGEVLTAAFWNEQVRDNTNALYQSIQRIGFQTRTTNYTINQTAIASAADVFASDISWTADGTSSYKIKLYVPTIETGQTANSFVSIHMVDGAGNDLGRMSYVGYADGTRSALQGALTPVIFYTPAAGDRTVNVRMIYSGASGNATFGAGGSGNNMTGWLAVYGPDLT